MNNGQDTMIATVPNINTRSSPSARKLGRATPEVSSNNDHSGNQITTSAEVKKDPVLIEVKPLPKIRLSLMPSPREEDEEENSVSSSSRQPNSSKDGESDQFDSLAARMDLRNLQQQQLQAKDSLLNDNPQTPQQPLPCGQDHFENSKNSRFLFNAQEELFKLAKKGKGASSCKSSVRKQSKIYPGQVSIATKDDVSKTTSHQKMLPTPVSSPSIVTATIKSHANSLLDIRATNSFQILVIAAEDDRNFNTDALTKTNIKTAPSVNTTKKKKKNAFAAASNVSVLRAVADTVDKAHFLLTDPAASGLLLFARETTPSAEKADGTDATLVASKRTDRAKEPACIPTLPETSAPEESDALPFRTDHEIASNEIACQETAQAYKRIREYRQKQAEKENNCHKCIQEYRQKQTERDCYKRIREYRQKQAEKENNFRTTSKPCNPELHRSYHAKERRHHRCVTVAQAPRFATTDRLGEWKQAKKCSPTLAQSIDIMKKDLRNNSDDKRQQQSSIMEASGPHRVLQHNTTLTIPQTPNFATAARFKKEKIPSPLRKSFAEPSLAQSIDILQKDLRNSSDDKREQLPQPIMEKSDDCPAPHKITSTIPQPPKFATAARFKNEKIPSPSRKSFAEPPLAHSVDVFGKGLRG